MNLNNLPYVVKNYLIKYLNIEILIILYDNVHYHDIIVHYLKNNTVEISDSESFLTKKYTFKKIGVADLQILPYKKKHKKNAGGSSSWKN